MNAGTVCLLLVATLGGPLVFLPQDEEEKDPAESRELPAEWRDQRRPDLREAWDALEGRPAPPLNGVSHWLQTDGRSWEDFQGKVVLLDLWARWSPACIERASELQGLHEGYATQGLVVLGVHASRGFEGMRDFVREHQLDYSFAADTRRKLGARLGVEYVPTYFAIDRGGTMRVAGAEHSKLEEIVKALLAEEPGAVALSDADGWPRRVEKKLWAKVDLRGQNAPPFYVGSWLTGEPDREGKVVLLDFWATWCPPCRKAIPELSRLQKIFAEDLVVIGVSDEDADTVRAFMADHTMAYAQGIDPRATMKSLVGVEGIPHVLLIDSTGVVRWQGYPFDAADPLTEDVVRRVIERDRAQRGAKD